MKKGERAFCAEGETVNDTQAREQRYASVCEILCAAHGKGRRQFEHEVDAAQNGVAGTLPFIENRRAAALCETAAHQCDDAGFGIFRTYGFNLVNVPVMKRIVFCDDADDIHGINSLYGWFF
ncbi:hypothetical protein SELSPUOL_00286 [Selenomonas sputigena ATCC 35185]|uniref:Uncharacterized protein n=1 Tax=Selenomonas sputigena (strain ATCC 35185 / DSM 20758 / CCUG 44933 / VPI D19B-28) TaxID=546271 RepID=C9LS63_SELS3|nr:hypothetical protein SELSPUOL_00286 [Selenomonas sputigena ATCC 35185]